PNATPGNAVLAADHTRHAAALAVADIAISVAVIAVRRASNCLPVILPPRFRLPGLPAHRLGAAALPRARGSHLAPRRAPGSRCDSRPRGDHRPGPGAGPGRRPLGHWPASIPRPQLLVPDRDAATRAPDRPPGMARHGGRRGQPDPPPHPQRAAA